MSRKNRISSGSIDRQNLAGVINGDPNDVEVLGYAFYSTTGEVVVQHEWLEEKWQEYDLPEFMLPGLPWTSSAFKRAMRFVVHPGKTDKFTVAGNRVEMNLRDGAQNTYHLEASEYEAPAEIDPENVEQCMMETNDGNRCSNDADEDSAYCHIDSHNEVNDPDRVGEWTTHKLGRFRYDSDNQDMVVTQEIDDESPIAPLWHELEERARDMFEVMQESHIGDDIRDILYYFTHFNTDAIKLRDGGAVYFVPAQHEEILNGLANVWDDMNDAERVWKQGDRGRRCEIVTMPVFDQKADVIERRVEQRIEEDVERALDDAFERLEDNDETASEIVSAISDDLRRISGIEDDYNTLLNAKLSAKRVLDEHESNVGEDAKKEIIEKAKERVTDDDSDGDSDDN